MAGHVGKGWRYLLSLEDQLLCPKVYTLSQKSTSAPVDSGCTCIFILGGYSGELPPCDTQHFGTTQFSVVGDRQGLSLIHI